MYDNKTTNKIQKKPKMPEQRRTSRKIGSTTYQVSVNFSRTSKENMDDKIIRLIQNDTNA